MWKRTTLKTPKEMLFLMKAAHYPTLSVHQSRRSHLFALVDQTRRVPSNQFSHGHWNKDLEGITRLVNTANRSLSASRRGRFGSPLACLVNPGFRSLKHTDKNLGQQTAYGTSRVRGYGTNPVSQATCRARYISSGASFTLSPR